MPAGTGPRGSASTLRYDVILFDSLGVPYTGTTPEHSGLGGSEWQSILLAEGLARRGHRVLVLNRTLLPARERGVDYLNHETAYERSFSCGALVVVRASNVPPLAYERLLVWVTDAGFKAHQHFEAFFSQPNATLVTISAWQRSLFPASWRAEVIPNVLPDSVYEVRDRPDRRRFVYASAAFKGLTATLEAWQEVKRDPRLAEAELSVCTPGYDPVDEAAIARAGCKHLGSLPFDAVVRTIASSAGLFYVNAFPETFCIVAALAEALGRRVHILCLKQVGALHETTTSPLVTTHRPEFVSAFREAYVSPLDDRRFHGAPRDFRQDTVMPRWLRALGLDASAAQAGANQGAPPQ
jgi:hypothetical protein